MLFTPQKKAITDRVGELHLVYSNVPGIDDSEWDAYIELFRALTQEHGPPRAVLLLTPRGGPNAAQRRRLSEAGAQIGLDQVQRTALMTASTLVRGAITAIAWLMPKVTLRSFGMGALDQALTFVAGAAKFDRAAVEARVRECIVAFGDSPEKILREG